MYLPLGGSQRKVFNVWPIFVFVAVWHDLEWKLVAWGVLNSIFLVVEVLAKRLTKTEVIFNDKVHTISQISNFKPFLDIPVPTRLVSYPT